MKQRRTITNIGPIGPEGCKIELNNILCLVGANNVGKSTILRSYELALGAEFHPHDDLCKRAGVDGIASVEMWVHIPEGVPNIDEKWKTVEGNYKLVQSKWEWSNANGYKRVRTTWDPVEMNYAEDGNASGADNVFNSRLPVPFRIGALEDPKKEHEKLLELLLHPIVEQLSNEMKNKDSEISQAINKFIEIASKPIIEFKGGLETIKANINKSHNAIFPDLNIDFEIKLEEPMIKPLDLLKNGSGLRFTDMGDDVIWSQQGTGSQRALFWTILQIRSQLKAIVDLEQLTRKSIDDKEKEIKKLTKDAATVKKQETKDEKLNKIALLRQQIVDLKNTQPHILLKQQNDEFRLPGYMLIIDEPEIGLHPNAVRAASKYLYGLANDPSWQIMLATHSPSFIDPLQDHTTIVRLERKSKSPTPKWFSSDRMAFSDDEKENLKLLNRFDQALAEMFFGQLPLIVEGDTEAAAFCEIMNTYPDDFPPSIQPTIIRARGKYTILSIIKILHEFKVQFAVLHDSDIPKRSDGKTNSSWKANTDIHNRISEIRKNGIKVVHRLSIPIFELAHKPPENKESWVELTKMDSDKPWIFVKSLRENPTLRERIRVLLKILIDETSSESEYVDYEKELQLKVEEWGINYCTDIVKFQSK